MKTKLIRIKKRDLRVMKKYLPMKTGESMPDYVTRYIDHYLEAQAQETFSN